MFSVQHMLLQMCWAPPLLSIALQHTDTAQEKIDGAKRVAMQNKDARVG